MTFSKSIMVCFAKFATFKGRASRSEHWWFFFFAIVASNFLIIVDSSLLYQSTTSPLEQNEGVELISVLVDLAVLISLIIPLYAVRVRRLHDIGKSGWWVLLEITIIGWIPLLIWLSREGDRATNNYGAPPLINK